MNILQFNVRLAEGGAAGVALIYTCARWKKDGRRGLYTVMAKEAREAPVTGIIRT